MEAIEKTLKWSQQLLTTCFGTPVLMSVSLEKGNDGKGFVVTTFIKEGNETKCLDWYFFKAQYSTKLLYDTWGKLKNDVSLLLDKYVGNKVNRHGRETKNDNETTE